MLSYKEKVFIISRYLGRLSDYDMSRTKLKMEAYDRIIEHIDGNKKIDIDEVFMWINSKSSEIMYCHKDDLVESVIYIINCIKRKMAIKRCINKWIPYSDVSNIVMEYI